MTPVMLEMYVSATLEMMQLFFFLLLIMFCHAKLPHSSLWYMFWKKLI